MFNFCVTCEFHFLTGYHGTCIWDISGSILASHSGDQYRVGGFSSDWQGTDKWWRLGIGEQFVSAPKVEQTMIVSYKVESLFQSHLMAHGWLWIVYGKFIG